jgi:hypothetical protein
MCRTVKNWTIPLTTPGSAMVWFRLLNEWEYRCIRDISTTCSRSITTTLTCSGRSIPGCRILITLLHILCLPERSTEIDRLSVEGTSKEHRGVYYLGPTFGFCYNYNKSANSKDPIIRERGHIQIHSLHSGM